MKTIIIREVDVTYKTKELTLDKISGPDRIAEILRATAKNNSQEHFNVYFLDGAHQIIGYSNIFSGSANMCTVHVREVFQRAIVCGAVSIIIAHNHPSGVTKESKEDVLMTQKFLEASKVLGVRLLDHVIVTDFDFLSFREHLNFDFN